MWKYAEAIKMEKTLVELLKEQKAKQTERKRLLEMIRSDYKQPSGMSAKERKELLDLIRQDYNKTPAYILNIEVFESGMPHGEITTDVTGYVKNNKKLFDIVKNTMVANSTYTAEETKLANNVRKQIEKYSQMDNGWYFVRAKLTDSDEPFIEFSGYFKRPSQESVTVSKGMMSGALNLSETKNLFRDAKYVGKEGKETPYKKLDVVVGIGSK
jgi:hypothetical protein